MRWALILAAPLLISAALAQKKQAPPPLAIQRSISSSKQFIIYFSDGKVRGRLARKAEDLKSAWLRRLELKDEWKAPIIVQLVSIRPANTPAMRTTLYESDGGEQKVQIDVYDLAALQGADFDFEIYRALCLEYAHRETPPKAGKTYTQPPAWIIEGFYADAEAREQGIPAGIFEMLVRNGPSPKLEAYLKLRPERLDATSRAVYRAQAMALLRALLTLPGGPAHLAEYLARLPEIAPTDPEKLLEKFPELAGQPGNLSKIWTLGLAHASASDRVKPLGMGETTRQLALLLEVSIPKDAKKPEGEIVSGPEALPAIARSETGRFTLRQKAEDLLRLEMRAHPVMRPVVEEYRTIASELALKPGKNVEKRIRKNMELQKAVVTRTDEIEDYLNWFETAQLNTSSQTFDPGPAGRGLEIFQRTDGLTRQLDDLESRGW